MKIYFYVEKLGGVMIWREYGRSTCYGLSCGNELIYLLKHKFTDSTVLSARARFFFGGSNEPASDDAALPVATPALQANKRLKQFYNKMLITTAIHCYPDFEGMYIFSRFYLQLKFCYHDQQNITRCI